MKLRVLGRYRNDNLGVVYQVGQEIELEDEMMAGFLLRDAPGCFEVVTEKAVKRPAKDKMVKDAPESK